MLDGVLEKPFAEETEKAVRLLYVEDDHIGAAIVKRSLERRPEFLVDLAENGEEGLKLASAYAYHIVLVDHDMPGMGGIELVRILRERNNFVPAIMVTGAGDEATAINALRSGCKDYIIKDGDGSFLHLLPAVIDQVLKQEAAERMLEQKNRENQRLLAELLESNKQLKRLNELKNEVLGIAAHDLRSPMSAILAAVNYLMEMEENRNSRRYSMLGICRSSSNQALNMIDELLNPERLVTGEIELMPRPAKMGELVQEVIDLNKQNAQAKGIEIHFSQEPDLVGIVDPFRFRELADNLLSNAIKYSPWGSTVRVSVFSHPGGACLEIKDEGPGFTPEDKRHLYKRFCRLSARPTGNEPSTGLGLSIVKKIADLHNATIELVSEPGLGAAFSLTFSKP